METTKFTVAPTPEDWPGLTISWPEKEDPDKQCKADMRRESQVLNPDLPRRFKKGSKR